VLAHDLKSTRRHSHTLSEKETRLSMSSRLLPLLFVAAMAFGPALHAQAPDGQATANPELVGALSKELGSTPQQAEGAAGALFGLAKTKLNPSDWSKVAGAVPGMDGLLKAAPTASAMPAATAGAVGTSGLGAVTGAAGAGGLASMAGSFSKLGLKPEMVAKAVPVLTNYVTKSGGAGVGQLLAGALK
jgi:Protein of unknown function VcgC/VcgE (DUF2780)